MDEKMLSRIDYMLVYGKRDDALYWLDLYVCDCLQVLRKEEDWLACAPRVEAPVPFLSELLHPGTDSSYGLAHRMGALQRRLTIDQTELGHVFLETIDDMDVLFEELKRVFAWRKIAEARTLFHGLIDYLPTAKKRKHTPERFEETVREMIAAFLAAWNALYDLCLAEEGARMAVPADNAYFRETQETIVEIRDKFAGRRKKGRPPTIANPIKRWLVERWFYLVDHPDCCRDDVKGRRILHLDFWETFEKDLTEKHLTTFDDADRALRTALANARTGVLGEECRLLVLAHAREK